VARYATGAGTGELREQVPPGGAIPIVDGFYLSWELALARAVGSGQAAFSANMLNGTQVLPIPMRRANSGAWLFSTQFDQAVEARADAAGRMLSFAIAGGGATVERVGWADIEALERAFTARDAASRGMGALSPLDNVRVNAGGASMVVVYSRPSLRGRALDVLVPPGEVWRMGANDATRIETDREVRFGDLSLAPGAYSLFTQREGSRWWLVINRQTGMSGLERDPARDVGRVPFNVGPAGEHAETFTLTIEPYPGGGVLRARWGTLDLSAPFQVP
jgi:hypothetical protein